MDAVLRNDGDARWMDGRHHPTHPTNDRPAQKLQNMRGHVFVPAYHSPLNYSVHVTYVPCYTQATKAQLRGLGGWYQQSLGLLLLAPQGDDSWQKIKKIKH